MHKDHCNGMTGLCDAMKPTNGTELLKYLRKVDFKGKHAHKINTYNIYLSNYSGLCP